MDTILPLTVKSLTTAAIVYVGSSFLMGDLNPADYPNSLLGPVSPHMASAIVAGTSQTVVDLLEKYVFDKAHLEFLGDFANPALVAGSSMIVPMLLMPGEMPDMSAMFLMAGYSGLSSMASSYTYDNFLRQYVEH